MPVIDACLVLKIGIRILGSLWFCHEAKAQDGASTTQSEWEENPAVCSVFSAATTAFIRETSLFGPELRPYKRSCVSVSHTKSGSSPSINSLNSRRPSETGQMHKTRNVTWKAKNICSDIE